MIRLQTALLVLIYTTAGPLLGGGWWLLTIGVGLVLLGVLAGRIVRGWR